ncbi:gamma secretase complex protein [Mortierella antarctica]|nr:gamma secretase complex protein [Mortierella antarctica]
MTLLTFFGCALTAYGPSLAIFFGHIAPNAQLVILMVSSAFFWLISLLLASAIWFMASSSRLTFTSTIIYTVLLQELFRWFLYLLINRAESGLNMVAKHPKSKYNRSGYAFSAGLGFGLMFGAISYITMLVQSLGPGVLMCVSSSYLTLLNSSKTINYGCAYSILGNFILLATSTIIVGADIRNIHRKIS